MSSHVQIVRHTHHAHIVLNNPQKLNAIGTEMLHGLAEAVRELSADARVRAVVVRGEGKAFSAGGDLSELGDVLHVPERFDAFLDLWHGTFEAIDEWSVPTIAAVHGVAFAGGFELTHVCDFVIAAEGAVLGDQHARFGLFPAGGSTQRLARLVGERRAKWLLASGEPITPTEALEIGLVNAVVPDDTLIAEADRMAELLASRSADATAAIKQALALGRGIGLHEALRLERPLAVEHQASRDARIGVEAFRNRTKPEFISEREET